MARHHSLDDPDWVDLVYRYVDVEYGGRRYRLDNLQGPGGDAHVERRYEVMGVTRYWRYPKVEMDMLIDMELIVQTKPGTIPRIKRYLDEAPNPPTPKWSRVGAT